MLVPQADLAATGVACMPNGRLFALVAMILGTRLHLTEIESHPKNLTFLSYPFTYPTLIACANGMRMAHMYNVPLAPSACTACALRGKTKQNHGHKIAKYSFK